MLSLLTNKWVLAIGGSLIAAASLWATWAMGELRTQSVRVAALNARVASETQRADENARAALALVEAQQHNERVAAQVAGLRRQIDTDVRAIQERISRAPDSDDAPLSPILLDALDGLRDVYDARVADRAGEGGNPHRTEDVQAAVATP